MKTVKEVSRISGVSIRTLHHYDAIGLLKPSRITEAGYRLYDEAALGRLKLILLFRELQFPLKEIKQILDNPQLDAAQILPRQIRLLELKRDHLDKLILHARQIQRTGVLDMNFETFDTTELENYAAQAREKWGHTEAYREYEQKTQGQSPAQMQADGDELMAIFAEIGAIRHTSPESADAQTLVQKLQAFITAHYYTCTPQILRGLGQMYIAGDSMTENIDRTGGEGTAAFTNRAIEYYCR